MAAKTLARIINHTYVARAIELKEMGEESTISLLEWVYDSILNRYAILKISEKKFISLLSACIHYRNQSSRIRMFGRFLCLYDDLSM